MSIVQDDTRITLHVVPNGEPDAEARLHATRVPAPLARELRVQSWRWCAEELDPYLPPGTFLVKYRVEREEEDYHGA